MNFAAYIALGDSISIDLYPALDLKQPPTSPLGAASLLCASLRKINPEIDFANLCVDGATTYDLLEPEALHLVTKYANAPALITLTIGGNDMLASAREGNVDVMNEVADTLTRITQLVSNLVQAFPRATIILNSIYDPTDDSGQMPKMTDLRDKLPFLKYLNHEIKKLAEKHNLLFADIYSHFQGHGYGKPDCYYWFESPIEPSAKGAEALRDLWLTTLKNADRI